MVLGNNFFAVVMNVLNELKRIDKNRPWKYQSRLLVFITHSEGNLAQVYVKVHVAFESVDEV